MQRSERHRDLDPVAELVAMAHEARDWKDAAKELVDTLESWRYSTMTGEQLDARVVVYERAQDRCIKVLHELAKLNLEERAVKISERQAATLETVILRVLRSLLPPEDIERGRQLVAKEIGRVRELPSAG